MPQIMNEKLKQAAGWRRHCYKESCGSDSRGTERKLRACSSGTRRWGTVKNGKKWETSWNWAESDENPRLWRRGRSKHLSLIQKTNWEDSYLTFLFAWQVVEDYLLGWPCWCTRHLCGGGGLTSSRVGVLNCSLVQTGFQILTFEKNNCLSKISLLVSQYMKLRVKSPSSKCAGARWSRPPVPPPKGGPSIEDLSWKCSAWKAFIPCH